MSKLFFICPFSCLENLLHDKFGDDVCFLTIPGAVFNLENSNFMNDVLDIILSEKVTDVYVVNDTSCIFINDILLRRKGSLHYAKQVIEEIYIDCYYEAKEGNSLLDQQIRLATFNVNYQIDRIANDQLFGALVGELKLSIHGMVTTKSKNQAHLVRARSYAQEG